MWIIKKSLKSSMQTKHQCKKREQIWLPAANLFTALLGSKAKSLLANSTHKISLIIGNK